MMSFFTITNASKHQNQVGTSTILRAHLLMDGRILLQFLNNRKAPSTKVRVQDVLPELHDLLLVV
jgi:hypothetical protein